MIHPNAIVETRRIGERTNVWPFAHILPGATVGSDCNICECVFVEDDVVVGDRVTVKNGVQLWNGVRLHDDVFVGPNATFTNDRWPRSRQHLLVSETTVVERGASIGANATVLPGVTVGAGAMVGAGAVVTKDVAPYSVVAGNPARPLRTTPPTPHLLMLRTARDDRGSLAALEFDECPFVPVRHFVVHDVPDGTPRGGHAHRVCQQLLVCVAGTVTVEVEHGQQTRTWPLRSPDSALYLPPMCWAEQTYTPGAVLVVLASHRYDPDDYVRDHDAFVRMT